MTKHDTVQLYLGKIGKIFSCTHESETYPLLKNILDFLVTHPRPHTLRHLSYHRLKGIAQIQDQDAENVRTLKVALYILSDPQINVLEQMFEVHDEKLDESISLSIKELSQYTLGGKFIHPITEQEVDAETFSNAVTSYFKTSQDFCQEVMS